MNSESIIGLLILVVHIHNRFVCGEIIHYHPILIQKYKNVYPLNNYYNAWMDIRKGIFPNISSEPINLGAPMSILIYLNNKQNSEINIKECWAYNQHNYRTSTMKLPLIDNKFKFATIQENKKPILVSPWTKKSYPSPLNTTLLLYTQTTGFKFPNSNNAYITCTIEICGKACSNVSSEEDSFITEKSNVITKHLNLFFGKITSTTQRVTTHSHNCILEHSTCHPKVTNIFRSLFSSRSTPDCSPESNIDPRCAPTVKPPNCIPGSNDARCISNIYSEQHTTTIASTIDCRFNSLNKKCAVATQASIVANLMYNPFLPPNCYPGSKDPRCKKIASHKPLYPFSVYDPFKPPNCYPGSTDIRCKQTL